jgi:hypothetical protein
MKTKPILTFIVGVLIGGAIMHSFRPLSSYFNTTNHVIQGKQILQLISKYEKEHGSAPSAEWFYSLEPSQITREGRQWIYFERPVNTNHRGGLRIIVPIDYGNQYLGGFQDGAIIATTPHMQNMSEQDAPPNR